MTVVVVMLLAFVVLGLFHHRLGRFTYLAAGVLVMTYMFYASSHP